LVLASLQEAKDALDVKKAKEAAIKAKKLEEEKELEAKKNSSNSCLIS
jgi:hypothetical protein